MLNPSNTSVYRSLVRNLHTPQVECFEPLCIFFLKTLKIRYLCKKYIYRNYIVFAFIWTKLSALTIKEYHTTALYFVFVNKTTTHLNYCFINYWHTFQRFLKKVDAGHFHSLSILFEYSLIQWELSQEAGTASS